MKVIHGPEADQVRAVALPILERLCGLARYPVPALHIVDRLPGSGKKSGRETAQATFRGGPGVILPAALVGKLSRPGLEHLLAHELGHLVLRRSRWSKLWNWFAAANIVLTVAVFGAFALVLSTLNDDVLWPQILALGLMIGFIADVLLMAFASRHREVECDLFAVGLLGDLDGAIDHMEHNANTGGGPRGRMQRLAATHPHPHIRLEIMKGAMERGEKPNRRGSSVRQAAAMSDQAVASDASPRRRG